MNFANESAWLTADNAGNEIVKIKKNTGGVENSVVSTH
jgi:hypothetical protein